MSLGSKCISPCLITYCIVLSFVNYFENSGEPKRANWREALKDPDGERSWFGDLLIEKVNTCYINTLVKECKYLKTIVTHGWFTSW